MAKKCRIHLSAQECAKLEALVEAGKAAATKRLRAQILLAADADHPQGDLKDTEIARALDVSVATVESTRSALAEHGLERRARLASASQTTARQAGWLGGGTSGGGHL